MVLTIKEYNQYLIINKIDIDMHAYFRIIKNQYYLNKIDEEFLGLFLNFVNTNKFIITEYNLFNFKVIPDNWSGDILEFIVKNKLQKNIDYQVTYSIGALIGFNPYSYKFTWNAFSRCLSRVENNKYTISNMICNDILKHYNEYDNRNEEITLKIIIGFTFINIVVAILLQKLYTIIF